MQIPFPPEMMSVKKWHVFKAKLPPRSDSEHRIIVVYKHLNNVKYFYVTSKIENAYKMAKYDINSIVRLNVSDWDALTKESCIQCNKRHLYQTDEESFKQACASGEYERLGEVPEKIKNAIIHAIRMSKSFTEAEKDALQ
ncbi:MAG: hypothetical protein LBB74_04210 [Chitinispirillales bacterium]|jgi:hypothetical protein|nr:hypothetical protein [Chitinispirillales bacterium]